MEGREAAVGGGQHGGGICRTEERTMDKEGHGYRCVFTSRKAQFPLAERIRIDDLRCIEQTLCYMLGTQR